MIRGRVLLINPQITSARRARFPLSLLTMAAALEDKYDCTIIDGNHESAATTAALRALQSESFDAVGISVMGGPQVQTAIEISKSVREFDPSCPIIWGGYFPTLYPKAALNAGYVDYLVRGQGESTFLHLLDALSTDERGLGTIAGLSWKTSGALVHNPERRFASTFVHRLPYEKLGDPHRYLVPTFLGRKTAAHQAALGCRFRCTFCGVAALFRGHTALPSAQRLEIDLRYLRDHIGADSVQFYDHNFFDREVDMVPLLEVLAHMQLPWWCYARADALINLSAQTWRLVRQSKLRMAYIGAESPSDQLLRDIRKGTRSDQTLEVADLCRHQGVIPELSFMVAPPHDPEGETERTFDFIHEVKHVNPDAEIIVYVYTPLPLDSTPNAGKVKVSNAPLFDVRGEPIVFPSTPEEWTQPQWVAYSCHADAPWLTDSLRRRIRDFVTVLRCRFPTVQDTRSPRWAKKTLRTLASWRYHYRKYNRPWELDLSNRLVGLLDPRASSI